ncbi:MAG: DUF4389 domain-containing protein [Pseudohongiella sp.]|nr:DUF4389 domain-containing protein [Pseudohongiella sp.]
MTMSDEIVNNLKKPSAWFRVLFMAGFVIALYVAGVILLVVMLAQIIFSLLTGEDNINLRRLGANLASYVTQILAFLTYNSEQKPFPFLPFPLEPSPDGPFAQPAVEPTVARPVVVEPVVSEPVATEPAVTEPAATEPTAPEPTAAQQAVADDDGFNNVSGAAEVSLDDAASYSTEPAAARRRTTSRKKKTTDPEEFRTDD